MTVVTLDLFHVSRPERRRLRGFMGFVTDVTVVTLGAHVTTPSAKSAPDTACPVRVPPRSAGGLDPVPVIGLHFSALLRTGHALQLPPSRIPGVDGGGDGGGHHRHGQR